MIFVQCCIVITAFGFTAIILALSANLPPHGQLPSRTREWGTVWNYESSSGQSPIKANYYQQFRSFSGRTSLLFHQRNSILTCRLSTTNFRNFRIKSSASLPRDTAFGTATASRVSNPLYVCFHWRLVSLFLPPSDLPCHAKYDEKRVSGVLDGKIQSWLLQAHPV